MQILELLKKSTEYLEKKGISNPRVEAEILICNTLNCKRVNLYSDFEKIVNEDEKEVLRGFLRRRINGEPLQYITGKVSFRFIELIVKENVFIPRPETEILVQLVLDYLKKDTANDEIIEENSKNWNSPNVLEIGTGAGAIAISLAKEADCKVTATDINGKAIELAKINAKNEKVDEKINFIESRFFDRLPQQKYDLIVSNPPYVAELFKENLPLDVMREPREALFGGKDGLDAVKEILKQAPGYLIDGGVVFLEISPEQKVNILKFAQNNGFSKTCFEKDLTGKVRFVKALYGTGWNK